MKKSFTPKWSLSQILPHITKKSCTMYVCMYLDGLISSFGTNKPSVLTRANDLTHEKHDICT